MNVRPYAAIKPTATSNSYTHLPIACQIYSLSFVIEEDLGMNRYISSSIIATHRRSHNLLVEFILSEYHHIVLSILVSPIITILVRLHPHQKTLFSMTAISPLSPMLLIVVVISCGDFK